jgi:predicted phosphodiesterase
MSLEPILVVSDAHHPYVDHKAWKLMLKVAKDLKPKHIVIIGDFVDMFSVSSHSKDPARAGQLVKEVAAGEAALDELDELKAKNKIYLGGNHEDRLQRYLQDKAPELFGIVNIPKLLQLKRRGWRYIDYKHDTRLGKLWLTHDIGTAGRYAGYKALDTYQHSVITGHTHRLSYIVEGNATGEVKLSAQFGWLGDAQSVDYMSRVKVLKDWALGFGVGYLDPKTGLVYMQPIPIIGGYSACVNGKLYR